jgi:hypothetical protein
MIELYSGGANGSLLAIVPLPDTGNNGLATVMVGVSQVDFMRVVINGSAAIDNIVLSPEVPQFEEVLYLSDTALKGDDASNLYRVEIDEAEGRANLILLPFGDLDYDHVDTLSCTPDGSRLYFIDDGNQPAATYQATLGYYQVETGLVHEVGIVNANGEQLLRIDQAAFSPVGDLYITSSRFDTLYVVDLGTAEASELGKVVDQATGTPLNITGADIAFSNDGTLYLWANESREGAPRGLYVLALPAQGGLVEASFIGPGSDIYDYVGFALRANGAGDLVGSTPSDSVHVISKSNAEDVFPPLPLYLDGVPFNSITGDMSIGPFAQVVSNQ